MALAASVARRYATCCGEPARRANSHHGEAEKSAADLVIDRLFTRYGGQYRVGPARGVGDHDAGQPMLGKQACSIKSAGVDTDHWQVFSDVLDTTELPRAPRKNLLAQRIALGPVSMCLRGSAWRERGDRVGCESVLPSLEPVDGPLYFGFGGLASCPVCGLDVFVRFEVFVVHEELFDRLEFE
jgi:hypothetical protein